MELYLAVPHVPKIPQTLQPDRLNRQPAARLRIPARTIFGDIRHPCQIASAGSPSVSIRLRIISAEGDGGRSFRTIGKSGTVKSSGVRDKIDSFATSSSGCGDQSKDYDPTAETVCLENRRSFVLNATARTFAACSSTALPFMNAGSHRFQIYAIFVIIRGVRLGTVSTYEDRPCRAPILQQEQQRCGNDNLLSHSVSLRERAYTTEPELNS